MKSNFWNPDDGLLLSSSSISDLGVHLSSRPVYLSCKSSFVLAATHQTCNGRVRQTTCHGPRKRTDHIRPPPVAATCAVSSASHKGGTGAGGKGGAGGGWGVVSHALHSRTGSHQQRRRGDGVLAALPGNLHYQPACHNQGALL